MDDLVGQRYGKWVVIEKAAASKRSEARWLCRCDCGEMRVVFQSSLRNGSSKSCGCARFDNLDLAGVRFGALTVVEKAPRTENVMAGTKWICQCDCGKTVIATASELRSKSVRSCGHIKPRRETEPKQNRPDTIEISFAEFMRLADAIGINGQTAYSRLQRGMSAADALLLPVRKYTQDQVEENE